MNCNLLHVSLEQYLIYSGHRCMHILYTGAYRIRIQVYVPLLKFQTLLVQLSLLLPLLFSVMLPYLIGCGNVISTSEICEIVLLLSIRL